MDLRDLYQNLCPLDYNINMIKLDHFDVLSTEQYKWLKQCSDNKNNCCLIV